MIKKFLLKLALSGQERFDIYNILLDCKESRCIGEEGYNSDEYERIVKLKNLFKN